MNFDLVCRYSADFCFGVLLAATAIATFAGPRHRVVWGVGLALGVCISMTLIEWAFYSWGGR